jgi:hypothetical protein
MRGRRRYLVGVTATTPNAPMALGLGLPDAG